MAKKKPTPEATPPTVSELVAKLTHHGGEPYDKECQAAALLDYLHRYDMTRFGVGYFVGRTCSLNNGDPTPAFVYSAYAKVYPEACEDADTYLAVVIGFVEDELPRIAAEQANEFANVQPLWVAFRDYCESFFNEDHAKPKLTSADVMKFRTDPGYALPDLATEEAPAGGEPDAPFDVPKKPAKSKKSDELAVGDDVLYKAGPKPKPYVVKKVRPDAGNGVMVDLAGRDTPDVVWATVPSARCTKVKKAAATADDEAAGDAADYTIDVPSADFDLFTKWTARKAPKVVKGREPNEPLLMYSTPAGDNVEVVFAVVNGDGERGVTAMAEVHEVEGDAVFFETVPEPRMTGRFEVKVDGEPKILEVVVV